MRKLIKVFVIFGLLPLFFKYDVNADDKKITSENESKDRFVNPLFYQNLSNDTFLYVLTPDSKYYESNEITNTVQCQLIENKQYNIKLICDDCIDAMCLQKQERTHDFFLSESMQKDKLYHIKHRVTDKLGNSIFQENITTDGYLARRPDLL